ncbi:MAG: ankyrin repeat protein [Daejeonella sp.]|nr:ankyrin repeat protein [Daejeonella sp.]
MKTFLILFVLITACYFNGFSQALKDALSKKDTVLAAQIVKDGANPDEVDGSGATLLMQSCHFPNLTTARFLLSHGATTEIRSPKGRTALMVACAYWCGNDMVELLIKNGADVNAQSQDGSTPLQLAAANEKLDVVLLLLKHGADANKKNMAGKTALDLATAAKVESYMPTSIKDTRFDKEKVIEALTAAMK